MISWIAASPWSDPNIAPTPSDRGAETEVTHRSPNGWVTTCGGQETPFRSAEEEQRATVVDVGVLKEGDS